MLLASYEYDAWDNGTVTSHNANYNIGELNPIRYRGYYYDTDTELYYCASRYYDPEIGRWLNADTERVVCEALEPAADAVEALLKSDAE